MLALECLPKKHGMIRSEQIQEKVRKGETERKVQWHDWNLWVPEQEAWISALVFMVVLAFINLLNSSKIFNISLFFNSIKIWIITLLCTTRVDLLLSLGNDNCWERRLSKWSKQTVLNGADNHYYFRYHKHDLTTDNNTSNVTVCLFYYIQFCVKFVLLLISTDNL